MQVAIHFRIQEELRRWEEILNSRFVNLLLFHNIF